MWMMTRPFAYAVAFNSCMEQTFFFSGIPLGKHFPSSEIEFLHLDMSFPDVERFDLLTMSSLHTLYLYNVDKLPALPEKLRCLEIYLRESETAEELKIDVQSSGFLRVNVMPIRLSPCSSYPRISISETDAFVTVADIVNVVNASEDIYRVPSEFWLKDRDVNVPESKYYPFDFFYQTAMYKMME